MRKKVTITEFMENIKNTDADPMWIILPPSILKNLPVGLISDVLKLNGIEFLTEDELKLKYQFYDHHK